MKKRLLLLCIAILSLLPSTGCSSPTVQTYFSYATAPFHAEITGTLDGVAFSAEIGRDVPQNPEKPQAGLWIRYLSPQALSSLTLRFDDNECLIATLGDVSDTVKKTDASGWLRPLQYLLEEGTPTAVQKMRGSTVLTMPGYVLTLSENGLPSVLESPSLTVRVVWWECAK